MERFPSAEMRAALDRALQQAGVPVPSHPPSLRRPSESQPPTKIVPRGTIEK